MPSSAVTGLENAWKDVLPIVEYLGYCLKVVINFSMSCKTNSQGCNRGGLERPQRMTSQIQSHHSLLTLKRCGSINGQPENGVLVLKVTVSKPSMRKCAETDASSSFVVSKSCICLVVAKYGKRVVSKSMLHFFGLQ